MPAIYDDDWTVGDGNYGESLFPEPILERIRISCDKQGWLRPGEKWEQGGKPYGPASSIGKGWLSIIVDLDQKLAEIDPGYEIHQIKEKFGGLRYYVKFSFESGRTWSKEKYEKTGNGEIIHDQEAYDRFQTCQELIAGAEYKASITCEVCGEPGETVHTGGWSRTRCELHR